jgi:hypothetical protein
MRRRNNPLQAVLVVVEEAEVEDGEEEEVEGLPN